MDIDECREKVAQMSKSIFQYCLSRTSSYQESEDLSQEILLTLCDSIANLRDEKAFYAFVWRTADNILKGWYRNKDKRNTAELDDTIWDAAWERLAEQTQENEQLTLIMRELALLNSNYRRVMVAYYIDGLSVRDISARFCRMVEKSYIVNFRLQIMVGIEGMPDTVVYIIREHGHYLYHCTAGGISGNGLRRNTLLVLYSQRRLLYLVHYQGGLGNQRVDRGWQIYL